MNGRRPLAELLGELAEGALGFAGAGAVRARSISLSLPIDIRLVPGDDGPTLIGDVPLFRMRTAFDPEPARIEVSWHAVLPEAVAP
jgi:hypothetical protein